MYINATQPLDVTNPLQCIFKSISTEGFQSSRTNAIALRRVTNEYEPSNKDIANTDKVYRYRITIRVLGIDMNIPLFILFRALGKTTDKEILSYIVYINLL